MLTPKQEIERDRNTAIRKLREEADSKMDFMDEAALITMRHLVEKREDGRFAPNPKLSYEVAESMWEERQRIVAKEKKRLADEEDEIMKRGAEG